MRVPNKREALEQMLNARKDELLSELRKAQSAAKEKVAAFERAPSLYSKEFGDAVNAGTVLVYEGQFYLARTQSERAKIIKAVDALAEAHDALQAESARLESALQTIAVEYALGGDFGALVAKIAAVK